MSIYPQPVKAKYASSLIGRLSHNFLEMKGLQKILIFVAAAVITIVAGALFHSLILPGYDTPVICGFGIGSFKNDPAMVAQIYKDVLDNYFKGGI